MAGDELFRRKIPENPEELVSNLLHFGAYRAAEWFKKMAEAYSLQRLIYPHQIRNPQNELQIPEGVVVDMFRAVPLKNGEQLYKGKEVKITEINVHELYTLQKLVFGARVNYFKKILDRLPERPTLLIQESNAAIYMPPVIEVYEDGKPVIIDGVHRSYAKGIINGSFAVVAVAVIPYSYLPARLQGKLLEIPLHKGWTVQSTSAKFDDLNKDLFRMYNYLGFGKGGKKNGRYL